jgi:hypothetical protein
VFDRCLGQQPFKAAVAKVRASRRFSDPAGLMSVAFADLGISHGAANYSFDNVTTAGPVQMVLAPASLAVLGGGLLGLWLVHRCRTSWHKTCLLQLVCRPKVSHCCHSDQRGGSDMTVVLRIAGVAALGAAMLGCGLSAPPAQAAYTVTLAQVGSNVVATGSGTIDTAGLGLFGHIRAQALIGPHEGEIFTGPASITSVDVYASVNGPSSLGSTTETFASTGSGDLVGIFGIGGSLLVPAGYISGSALSDTSTYDNQTFSGLGVTPGTYVWTWSSDSFTLDIPGAAVPEPSSLGLLALPLGFAMLLAARHRRTTRKD